MSVFKRPRSARSIVSVASMVLMATLTAFPATGGEGNGRLSLRACGGAGLLGWGDVKFLKDSHNQQILYAASKWGMETAGSCANPPIGWQAEVELRYDLNRRFGLGIACGRNRRTGETAMTADLPPFLTSLHTWGQSTVLTTAVLNAYWNLPLDARSTAYVSAGAGFGSAVWNCKIRDEETIDIASWEQIKGTARDQGLLVQAGVGYEFRVAKRLILFVEARGQILSLNDWQGEFINSTDATQSAPLVNASSALPKKIWLGEIAASGGRPVQAVLVASTFSPDPELYDGVRAFRLNFSGAVFQVGFRLELGARPWSSDTR